MTKTRALQYSTAESVRLASRSGSFTANTAGVCPDYVQANLIILPSKYASDFRGLCRRNPTSCPLLGENIAPGNPKLDKALAGDSDIRYDAPGYNVYKDGRLVEEDVRDIAGHWAEDSVAFLIGCSFSFEQALSAAGFTPKHQTLGRNVPMYKTNIPLCPSGVFSGNTVVSMRPYKAAEIEKVRNIIRPYIATHGGPIAWGPDATARLGISDLLNPEFGEAPIMDPDEEPVFWACGVTPQLVIMSSPAAKGISIGHTPGKMVCLDLEVEDVLRASSGV